MVLGFSETFPWGDPTHFKEKILSGQKIHTIREDKNRRWSPGMNIHFATGVRTPSYNCFKEGECTGVQRITIEPRLRTVCIAIPEFNNDKVGGCFVNIVQKPLIKNDGFDSIEEFWKWFNEPFCGVLIHWTDKRY